jgi:hypothetical protein
VLVTVVSRLVAHAVSLTRQWRPVLNERKDFAASVAPARQRSPLAVILPPSPHPTPPCGPICQAQGASGTSAGRLCMLQTMAGMAGREV